MEVRGDNIIVSVENLTYSYGKFKAIDNISFKLSEGEVLVVLGPNGAGKTTLLKCLLKILSPWGTIYIDGKNINDMSRRELAKLIGYVPQIHNTIFAYRVIDFVIMGRAPHHSLFSMPSRKEYEKAYHLLKTLNIEDLADRTIAEISGGQLQLVVVARALMQEAKILLLDEPTAHLDISNKLKVLSTIRELVKKGIVKAAIMSMHDPLLASLYGDKIVLLKNGRMLGYGPPSEVLTNNNLHNLYGVEFMRMKHKGQLLIVPKHFEPYGSR